MPEKKTDRRTLKTRKALCEALAELLMEKELHKITVQEIADKADVNRVTFYKHYMDVYDLYENIEKDVLIEMGLLILRLEELPSEKFFSYLISYIDENRAIFRMIVCPNTTWQLKSKIDKLLSGLFLKMQSEKQSADINDHVVSYQAHYRSHGCMAVIFKWVADNFSEPKDFIIKVLSELDRNTEKFIVNKM
ncbi:MAG: TetR/AcrR family transcriptional regulator [Clostridia bacterium]|nr:TetR/AcrR family transcriptional regulator [Clostridia bacterium]